MFCFAEIRTSGRKITVILKDSLLPNTTYTIDFSDAIIDNNERNPLYGFAYSFSTGPKIDSLQVSGISFWGGETITFSDGLST